jgi:competence protein ComEC
MAALAAAAVFLWTTGHRPPERTRATFLSVGSGNANLVELPNGRTLLYDAGSALSYVRAGEGTIAPALWSRGIERLDAVFISHPHFDHFKDLLPIVKRFGIRRVFVPPTFVRKRMEADDDVLERLADRGVRVEFLGAGDRLAGTGGVEVRALWPRGPASQTRKINDGSLVLEIEERGRRLLLTGDIEAAAIAALLAAEPNLKADVMLWPHHGSDPDAVGRLAQRAGAQALVVSCGPVRAQEKDPPWVAEQGIRCCRTGVEGAVTVRLDMRGRGVHSFSEH